MSSTEDNFVAGIDQLESQPVTEPTPLEVRSRGRIYTRRHQRDRLGVDGYGEGTEVAVAVTSTETNTDYQIRISGVFEATLGRDGQVVVPKPIRERLDVGYGDLVETLLQRVP